MPGGRWRRAQRIPSSVVRVRLAAPQRTPQDGQRPEVSGSQKERSRACCASRFHVQLGRVGTAVPAYRTASWAGPKSRREQVRHPTIRLETVLLSVFVIAAAACGGSSSSTGNAAAGPPIKLGMIDTLSGPTAGVGTDGQKGANVAVDEINKAGGILGGRKFEIVPQDEQLSPTASVKAVRDLSSQGVNLLFGFTSSSDALAAVPVARQLGMSIVASHASATP